MVSVVVTARGAGATRAIVPDVMRLAALVLLATVAMRPAPPTSVDAAMADYWRAPDAAGRAKAAARLLAAKPDFDDLYARLKKGRTYGPARAGEERVSIASGGVSFTDLVIVPDGYDPARRWPLRVQLHGGVGRPEPPDPGAQRNRLPGEPAIYALPVAWSGVEWWRDVQIDHIARLVDWIEQRYNVDESRVYLAGVSDGGTGLYYHLLRDATRWSAGLPLIGNPRALANPNLEVDGHLFASNLRNRPIFAVNATGDQLYPAAEIEPWMQLLADGGVEVVFHTEPGPHGTSWWPLERDRFAAFAASHPRAAHPQRLTWETDATDRANRIQWLAIDALGATTSDERLRAVGIYADPGGAPKAMFGRTTGSGRVDVERSGNHFVAHARGVRRFTLLLSPDALDFSRPVTVTVNGVAVVSTPVTKDVATLLRWAARDDDRTMLYGAELPVQVPDRPQQDGHGN